MKEKGLRKRGKKPNISNNDRDYFTFNIYNGKTKGGGKATGNIGIFNQNGKNKNSENVLVKYTSQN